MSISIKAVLGLFLVTVATAGLFPLSPSQALAPGDFVGACKATNAFKFSGSTAVFFLNQHKHLVDIPNSQVKFKQGATNCVVVAFSADVAAKENALLEVVVELDGKQNICQPAASIFVGGSADQNVGAHAMNFVCDDVKPGNHTVQMQAVNIKLDSPAGEITFASRNTIVYYNE